MRDPIRLSRRSVLRTIGALGGLTAVTTSVGARPEGQSNTDTERYVGVVDRIVDGSFVVVLLEADDRVVDQLVVPVDEFDRIEERDVLHVVLKGGELHQYHHLPKKPGRSSRNDCGTRASR